MFIVFIIAVWAIIKACQRVSEQRRQAELARIRAEQERAKREAKWRAEMEREQRRLAAEQIRQAKEQDRQRREQERQAREQAKQAAQLAKHEEEIQRLKIRVKKAEEAFYHYKNVVNDCRSSINALDKEWAEIDEQIRQSSSASLLKRRDQIEKKIEALQTKEFNARQKMFDAKEAHDLDTRKIAA